MLDHPRTAKWLDMLYTTGPKVYDDVADRFESEERLADMFGRLLSGAADVGEEYGADQASDEEEQEEAQSDEVDDAKADVWSTTAQDRRTRCESGY